MYTKDDIAAVQTSALARRTVTIGDRRFSVLDFARRTIAMDLYMERMMCETGLDRVLPAQDEASEAYLVRLKTAVLDCGRVPELLAACLVPEGDAERDWRPVLAIETARHFERHNTEEDRDQVLQMCAQEVVIGFFRQGILRLNHYLERSKHG